MPGTGPSVNLAPGIHVLLLACAEDADGRDTGAFTRIFRRAMPGHDGGRATTNRGWYKLLLHDV
jgi:hypothetical protein